MKRVKLVLTSSILIFLTGIGLCSAQSEVVDHSFMFLDKNGLIIGYEVLYITRSKYQLDNSQKEKLFIETKKIASTYGRELPLADFYFKRDSVERKFIDHVLGQARKAQIKLKEVKIINLIVPEQIAEAISLRATSFNEPQPTRIKSYDK